MLCFDISQKTFKQATMIRFKTVTFCKKMSAQKTKYYFKKTGMIL